MWDTITYHDEDFRLGDDIKIVVEPGAEVYQGFLNVIERGYIVLVGTGCSVLGYTSLGFPLESITRMERA